MLSWVLLCIAVFAGQQELYEAGYRSFAERRYEDAVTHYRLLLQQRQLPSQLRSEASFSLGLAYKALNQCKDAADVLRPFASQDPRAREVLVSCLVKTGDDASLEEATQVLQAATRLSTATGDDFYALANHLKRINQLQAAAASYLEAVDWLRTHKVPARSILPRKGGGVWRWAVFLHSAGKVLHMLNQTQQALELYDEGVRLGLWVNPYQRYLQPQTLFESVGWVTPEVPFYPAKLVQLLEENYAMIKRDLEAVLAEQAALDASKDDVGFHREPENLHDAGYWDVFQFVEDGEWSSSRLAQVVAAHTMQLLQGIPELKDCIENECDAYFSRLNPHTHIESHCGPTPLRLRLHLGLKIPKKNDVTCLETAQEASTCSSVDEGDEGCCRLRVGNVTRRWEEGRVLVFDDSFEHEVWHDGLCYDRIVLSVDIPHPNAQTRTRNLP